MRHRPPTPPRRPWIPCPQHLMLRVLLSGAPEGLSPTDATQGLAFLGLLFNATSVVGGARGLAPAAVLRRNAQLMTVTEERTKLLFPRLGLSSLHSAGAVIRASACSLKPGSPLLPRRPACCACPWERPSAPTMRRARRRPPSCCGMRRAGRRTTGCRSGAKGAGRNAATGWRIWCLPLSTRGTHHPLPPLPPLVAGAGGGARRRGAGQHGR